MLLTALAHFVNKAGACSLAAPLPRLSTGPCPKHGRAQAPAAVGTCPVRPWAPLPPAPRLCKLQAPPVICIVKTTEGEKNNSN